MPRREGPPPLPADNSNNASTYENLRMIIYSRGTNHGLVRRPDCVRPSNVDPYVQFAE